MSKLGRGVSEDDVRAAMAELEAAGKSTSVDNIRHHLGSGSPNTILKHKRSIGESNSGMLDKLSQVSEELAGLVLALQHRIKEESEKTITAAVEVVREECNQLLTQAQAKVDEAEQTAALLQRDLANMTSNFTAAESNLKALNEKYTGVKVELATKTEALNGAETNLRERDRKLATLEGQLNHEVAGRKSYEEATQLTFRKLENDYAASINKLQSELNSAEAAVQQRNEQISQLNDRVSKMDFKLTQASDQSTRLRSELEKVEERFETQEVRLDDLRIQAAGDSARVQLLTEQNKELTKQLEARASEASANLAAREAAERRASELQVALERLEKVGSESNRPEPRSPAKPRKATKAPAKRAPKGEGTE